MTQTKLHEGQVDISQHFSISTGHDHDGSNSKNIAYTNVTGTPAISTGTEINTGSENGKIVTPKAIADSNISKLNSNLTRARLGSNQKVNSNTYCRLEFDTLDSDINNNYDISDWYGTAGAYRQAKNTSTASTINDDTANFPNLIIGAKVSWASNSAGTINTGYGYVTGKTSTSLTIIKTEGSDFGASYYYYIRNRYYVVPVAGYYLGSFSIRTNEGEVGKRYGATLMTNDAGNICGTSVYANGGVIEIGSSGIAHLNANDKLWVRSIAYAFSASTINLSYIELATYMSVILLKAD